MGLTPIGKGPGFCNSHTLPKEGNAKIVIAQRVYNRFRDDELIKFIDDVRASLENGGMFHVFVQKHDEVQAWVTKNDKLRHLAFGNGWENVTTWIRDIKEPVGAISLIESRGFEYKGEFNSIDNLTSPVPAWGLSFVKIDNKKEEKESPSFEYLSGMFDPPSGGIIADLGPGNYPFPGANLYLEHPSRISDKRYKKEILDGRQVIFADIQKGIPEIQDKYIDFLWAAHIMEHLDDPITAAKEMCRIAKKGVVVVPSPYKDTLFFWEEWEHKWDIYKRGQKLIFVKRDIQQINNIQDPTMQSYLFNVLRGKIANTSGEKYARQWFKSNERFLDIVLEWEGSFEIEVV